MTPDDVEDLLKRFPPQPSALDRDAALMRAHARWDRPRRAPWMRIALVAAAACVAIDVWTCAREAMVATAAMPAVARAPAHPLPTDASAKGADDGAMIAFDLRLRNRMSEETMP
jgi:hypothetical protein